MGVLTPPADDPSLASKPKERQFQVVPIPCSFQRGRWKCCDFREAQLAESGILEFVKPSKHPIDALQNASTIIVTNVAPTIVEALAKQQQMIENEGRHVESLPDPIIIAPTPSDSTLTDETSTTQPDISQNAGSGSTTLSTQDAMNLLNDLRIPNFDTDISRKESSATINIPVTSSSASTKVDPTDTSAIDSKIEQAMDLVKSHVTFAVRQEVEELKTTITSLQAKVALLESENHFLKRFAPPDILANLPNLVQSKMPHPVHKAESIVSEQQSSSRNLSPAPSEFDEQQPITMAAHHSLPPVSHSSRPALRIPTVASVAMMDSTLPSTPPSAAFPSMGIFEPPQTPGLPRSASAVETTTTQIPPIDENIQEDHTRQMTPPQHLIHPSHSTSHMVRQFTPAPQTPQPLTFPHHQPSMHSYLPQMHQQPNPAALIRQMSPPIPIMNPQHQHQQQQMHHDQRHFSPPIVMSPQEAAAAYPIGHQPDSQQQQATNPFSPTSLSQPNNIFHPQLQQQQHFPSSSQQQQQAMNSQIQQQQQQHQNFQNIPVISESQQIPVVHSLSQQQQQPLNHQQQQTMSHHPPSNSS